MYQLYGSPGRGSAAPEAVLEELGVPYEYIHLEPMAARKDAAYRKLNPQGQIPTLVDDGHAVWESAAICIYLCDRHPSAGLGPAFDAPERGIFYQWMFFLSNTLQPAYMMFFYPDRYYTDAARQPQISKDAEPRIAELWRYLDRALSLGPYLLGSRYSAADIYLYMLSTWHRESIISFSELPNVKRHIDLVAARPAILKMMERNAGH